MEQAQGEPTGKQAAMIAEMLNPSTSLDRRVLMYHWAANETVTIVRTGGYRYPQTPHYKYFPDAALMRRAGQFRAYGGNSAPPVELQEPLGLLIEFGQYHSAISQAECEATGNLVAIAMAMVVFMWLPGCETQFVELRDFAAKEYSANLNPPPDQFERLVFCTHKARRYDLLPREYRQDPLPKELRR